MERMEEGIKEKIEGIPAQEVELLKNFYKFLFFVSSAGYTIYGDKPICFDCIDSGRSWQIVEGFDYMDIDHILGRYRFREGRDVWLKYAHLFPLKGYSILFYQHPGAPHLEEVSIINHQAFRDTVGKYLYDFQAVLGEELSPDQILTHYVSMDSVFDRIYRHDGLFGTLLGFGRDNSWEFMGRNGGETMEGLALEDLEDTQHIYLPFFCVIPESAETRELRTKYEKQREKIEIIYQSPNFLEDVLIKLTSSDG
jgi:hypothetical protein